MDYSFIQDLKLNLPEIPANSIISQTMLDNDQVKAILFSFAAGQQLSEHTASMPAILHFISGEAHILLGKDEMDAAQDTWVYLPPLLPHSILAQTPLIMLLLLLK